jgi:hypothetical protein
MPIRGENIGTAYVRILADGKDLDKSIGDQMDDLDWDKMGRKGSKEFQEGWIEEQKKAPNQKALRDSISGALVRGKWLSQDFFRGENWQDFRLTLEKQFDEAGVRAGDNLERGMLEGMDFDGLSRQLDNLTPVLIKARKELNAELAEEDKSALREREERIQSHLDYIADRDKAYDQQWRDLADDRDHEFDLHIKHQQERINSHLDYIADRDVAYNEQWKRLAEERDFIFERDLRVQQERIESHLNYIADRDQAFNENRTRNLTELRKGYNDIAKAIDAYQRGEREGIAPRRHLIEQMERLRLTMTQVHGEDVLDRDLRNLDHRLRTLHPNIIRFNRGMDRTSDLLGAVTGRGSRNNFLNFIGSMVRNISKAIFVIPKLAIGIGVKLHDAFVKAGSTGAGLLAMVGALGGMLGTVGLSAVAAATAVGILVIALAPLMALFSGLLGIATALVATISFALVGAVGALAGAFLPLAAGVGVAVAGFRGLSGEAKEAAKGIGDAFKDLGKAATEGLMFDREAMAADHNHAVHSMAEVLGKVEGMVRDMRPVVVEIGRGMADAIDIVVSGLSAPGGAWAKFIDAISGANGEIGWMGRQSRRLGVIMGNTFGGLLGLFRGMMPLISQFLIWLRDITGEFNDWANSVRGQREIREFFRKAAESAKALGGFLADAWRFLRQLLDAGRETGDSIFKSMGDQLERFSNYLRENPDALGNWFADARKLASALGNAALAVGRLIDLLDSNASRTALRLMIGQVETVAGLLETAWKVSPINLANDAITNLSGNMEAVGTAVKSSSQSMADSLDQVTGAATRATRALVLQRLESQGLVDSAAKLGVSTRDLISASLGNEDAIKRVNRALRDYDGVFEELEVGRIKDAIGETAKEFDTQREAVRKSWNELTTWKEVMAGIKDKKLRVEIKTLGANASMADLGKLQEKYDLMPKELKLVAKALGFDLTKKQIQGLMEEGNKWATEYVAKLKADGQQAKNETSIVRTLLQNLENSTFNPKVYVTHNAAQAAAGVRMFLDAINDEEVWINVRRRRIEDLPLTASGGIFSGAQARIIGEAGREAVVPLDRPLSQVDPAVRALSAFAQGLSTGSKGGYGGSKTIDASGWTIVTPTEDPYAVATEVMNTLAASAYGN